MNVQKKLMVVRNTLRSGKDARNEFGKYNYRNAEQMLSAIKPILAEQNLTLAFSDEVVMIGNRYYMKTTLTVYDVEDGENFSVTGMAREQDVKKGMDEAQISGSTMTYVHKYALMSMFAISDPTLDPDAHDNRPQTNGPQAMNGQPVSNGNGTMTWNGQTFPEPPTPAESWQGQGAGGWQNVIPDPVYPQYGGRR